MGKTLIFYKYDVTSEIMMLALNIILLFLMLATQPKKTKMYKIALLGTHNTILTMLLHLAILKYTCFPQSFKLYQFNILYFLYITSYIAVLNEIFAYASLLSYKERFHQTRHKIKILILTIAYYTITLFPMVTNKLVVFNTNCQLMLTDWQYAVECCGILCATAVLFTTLYNRNSISKIVLWGVTVFSPIEIAVLTIQFYFKTVYFISFTYVIPFLLFYILFHCSTFDDIIGCQNLDGLDTRIRKAIKRRTNFVLIYISFPQLQKREFSDIKPIVENGSSQKCRKIENLLIDGHIYCQNIHTYTMFAPVKDQEYAEILAEKVRKIISEPVEYNGHKFKVYYKQVVLTSNSIISDVNQYISMIGYMSRNFSSQIENEFVVARYKDYIDFNLNYKVEQAILDIRAKNDLNDERVVSYIQPIHNIETESFRTGEALLRLKIDDDLILPDIVIRVAEANNCVHQITLIMLNKICQQIKKLEVENYDFDAITVNCSTEELDDPEFHNEIIQIVNNNDILHSHIRLEITESTTITNYQNIIMNMQLLNQEGITFYLDDFGTGYSNLERISTLPFNTIKFDKSILYSALTKESSEKLMKMLVKYCKNNNFTTVVEGVEDFLQYDYCKKIGFDYIQGYLFSKPLPSEKITGFFQNK